MACSKEHPAGSLPATFNSLPQSQAKAGRHKCAACAYELGRAESGAAEERLRNRVQTLVEENDRLKAELKKVRPGT